MRIEYQNKLVAFVDVLGFSEIVNTSDNEKIDSYYTYLESDFKGHIEKTNLQYFFISDSIVISADESKENLFELTRLLTKIQSNLLLSKIVLRGAVSFGKLYINNERNIIVGEGLIRAYQLETHSINPRIIIDRQLIPKYFKGSDDFISSFTAETNAGYSRSFVKIDSDNYPYINYLHYLIEQHPTYKFGRVNKILELLMENYYNNLYSSKYHWLLNKLIIELHQLDLFNDSFSKLKKLSAHTTDKNKLIKDLLKNLKSF